MMKRMGFGGLGELMTVLMKGLEYPHMPGQFAPKQLFGIGGVTAELAS
jgi:hypothetical protein